MPGSSSSYQVAEPPAFSSPMHYGGTLPSTGKAMEHDVGNTNMLADANKMVQVLDFSFIMFSTSQQNKGIVLNCNYHAKLYLVFLFSITYE